MSLKLKHQPFQPGQRVRPHHGFYHYYPGVTEVFVKTCEKGHCETGWLITIAGWKGEYDSSWFFKIENSKNMNIKNLDKAVELQKLLEVTKKGLAEIEKLLAR